MLPIAVRSPLGSGILLSRKLAPTLGRWVISDKITSERLGINPYCTKVRALSGSAFFVVVVDCSLASKRRKGAQRIGSPKWLNSPKGYSQV